MVSATERWFANALKKEAQKERLRAMTSDDVDEKIEHRIAEQKYLRSAESILRRAETYTKESLAVQMETA